MSHGILMTTKYKNVRESGWEGVYVQLVIPVLLLTAPHSAIL